MIKFTMLKTIAIINADVKLENWNRPPITTEVSSNISPLMIKSNMPSVTTVIGKDKTSRIGLTDILSSPKTIAAKKAVGTFATCKASGKNPAVAKNTNAFTRHRCQNPIICRPFFP